MTASYSTFLSVIVVVRNQADQLEPLLADAVLRLSDIVSEYEIVVVDNASTDESVARLKALTSDGGLPNLQVYALTKEVDEDTASWVGAENALGDFVAVINPASDDIAFLPAMLERATQGSDVVFATNERPPEQGFSYRFGSTLFNTFYQLVSGVHLSRDAPLYRILSKRVVNFILQHRAPALAYRHLPATAGFARSSLTYYSDRPLGAPKRRLLDGFDRAMRLIASTTRAPMRAVTWLSLFGAASNVLYSGYVIAIALTRSNVAPGWTTLSLQQSGMFLLMSLVLFVLGEYILHMASLGNEGPLYHVAQEFTSTRLTRKERLNIELIKTSGALTGTRGLRGR